MTKKMRILLFGADGQLGEALLAENTAFELIALNREQADFSQNGALESSIEKYEPSLVINAAAFTNVNDAETNPKTSERINAHAVNEIAKACTKNNAKLFHVSTDYVFDGAKSGPIPENEQPAPINVYGRTKLLGENLALRAAPDTLILRTSWVFASKGRNFATTMARLAMSKNNIDVVKDQIGGPTPASDIAKTIFSIADAYVSGSAAQGIYHYQGAPSVSWAEFANEIFQTIGANISVTPIPTSQYPTHAARPTNTVLDCSKIMRDFGIAQPDWRSALRSMRDNLKALSQ